MGHHPETLIFSFPPHVRTVLDKNGKQKPRRFAHWLHNFLYPFAGFSLWHVDPCENVPYNRDDDSCGWFERRPGEYASAMRGTLGDETVIRMFSQCMAGYGPDIRFRQHVRYPPPYVMVTALQIIAQDLEFRRRSAASSKGRSAGDRMEKSLAVARDLAINSVDNVNHIYEYERLVTIVAQTLARKFRPWWKHPRWHVHHWRFSFALPHNLRRAFVERCAHCNKPIGWGKSPLRSGDKSYHLDCPSA